MHCLGKPVGVLQFQGSPGVADFAVRSDGILLQREGRPGYVRMAASLLEARRLDGIQILLCESECFVHIITIAEIA